MTEDAPRRWAPLVVAAMTTCIVTGMMLLQWNQLPEPLATHWGFTGAPDSAMPKALLLVILTAPLLLVGLVSARSSAPRTRATWAMLTYSLSSMFVALTWSILASNRGASHWTQAQRLSFSHLALVLAALLVPLALCARAFRDVLLVKTDGEPAPALPLTAEQRAVWLSSARNRWLWLLALPAVPLLVFSSYTTPGAAAALVSSGLALFLADTFSYLRVRVERRGLFIDYGHLGLLRQHVALADIEHAEIFDLAPMAHGGWGYRGSLRLMKRAAVVIRAGSALRVALHGGKQLSITVDDPKDGASLLNGLVKLR